MAEAAIELIGIDKSFGAVRANRDINLTIERGTIRGIVGENGAGKSTLMSILYGFYQADSGEIKVGGQPVSIKTPNDAIALGIGMVHQHFMLVENFTVIENVILGAESEALLKKSIAKARSELERLEREYGLEVDPDAVIEELPVGLQQRVEILKALYRGAEILILDEPTGVLTPAEADHLFRILKQLKDQGKTIVLITHKLREIMAITDTVSVMRQGTVVATRETAKTTVEELAELMVGRRVLLRVEKGEANPGATKLAVSNLTVKDSRGVTMVNDVSFEVRGGEIVGIAGVDGNGQTELIDAIAGLLRSESGRIVIGGQDVTGDGCRDCLDAGLGHIPEDRQRRGLVLEFSLAENLALHDYDHPPASRYGWLFPKKLLARAGTLLREFDVRGGGPQTRAGGLSGGNQQKVVLAREIDRNPSVLIAAQPTRGLDVGAIEFVHRRLVGERDEGRAILLVSLELEEILSLSDRILVMYEGRIVGEFPPSVSEEELGIAMTGGGRREAA
jgi:ABC-type uncharacterized transport system ATPase subunit